MDQLLRLAAELATAEAVARAKFAIDRDAGRIECASEDAYVAGYLKAVVMHASLQILVHVRAAQLDERCESSRSVVLPNHRL